MKAILHARYGSPDLLRFEEMARPEPGDKEVLMKVRATTVSTGDCNMRNFTFVTQSMLPMAKVMFGIGKPWKERVLRTELAGEIVGVGKHVARFKPGDQVFGSTGMAGGGHAQYACLHENAALTINSDSLSWQDAVAIPFGANTSLYYLRDLGKIQDRQKLLIIGASGSISSASVQLGKLFGATVTAVCSGANVKVVKSLCADKVIDNTTCDFTKNAETHDLIFDVVGATAFDGCKHLLEPQGIFLSCIMGLPEVA